MTYKTTRFLKALIWSYSSIGVALILVIGFACFILPSVAPDRMVSPETLDLLEKILLGWGLILLPFLKVAQVYLKKHQHDKRRA